MTLSLEQRLARVTGLAELTSDPHVSEVQLLGDGRLFVRRREARVAAPSVVPAEELAGLLRALEARAALLSPDAGAAGAVGVEVGAFRWIRLSEPLARGVALFGVRLYEPRASWEALCRASRLPSAQRAAVERLVAQGHGVVVVGPAEARPERVLSGLLDLRPDAGHVVVLEGSRAVPLDGLEATSLRRPAMHPHERALCLPIAQRSDVLLGAQLRGAEDWAWCMGLGAQQRLLSLDAASPQEALAALLEGVLAQAPDPTPLRLHERLGLRALLACEPDGEGGPRLVEALALPSQPLSSASKNLALAPLAPAEPARFAEGERGEVTSPAIKPPEGSSKPAQAPTVALAPVVPVAAPVVPVAAPAQAAAPTEAVLAVAAPAPALVAVPGATTPMSVAPPAPEAAPKSEPKPPQRASAELERLTAPTGAPATVRVAAVQAEGLIAPPVASSPVSPSVASSPVSPSVASSPVSPSVGGSSVGSSSQTPSRPPVGVPLGPPSGPPPLVGAGRSFGGGEEAPKAPSGGRLPALPPTERLPQLLSSQDPPTLGADEDPVSVSLQVVTRKTIETPRLDLLMDAAELDEAQTRERPLVERPLPAEALDEPVDPALRLRRRLGRAPEPQSWGRSASEPAIPAVSLPPVAPAEPAAPAGPSSRGLSAHRTGEAPSLGRPLGGAPAALRSTTPTPPPSDKAPSPPGGVARLGGGGGPALRSMGGSGGFGAVGASPPPPASRPTPEPAPARPVGGGAAATTPARRASRFGAIERQASFKPAEPATPNVGSTLRSFQRHAADEGVEVQLGGAASGQEGSLDPSFPSDDGRTLQHSASDLGLDEDTTSQRSAGAFGPYAPPARPLSSQDATTEVRMEGKDARKLLREMDDDEP